MRIAGIDEVGRGAVAGIVVAGCVSFTPESEAILGVKDSKSLTALQRSNLSESIMQKSVWGIGFASIYDIAKFNIRNASLLAMKRAYKAMNLKVTKVLVDGVDTIDIDCECENVVKGDTLIAEISAASIIAKCWRDKYMDYLHSVSENYGFDSNKGYYTKSHSLALQTKGPSRFHRMDTQPVKSASLNLK